MNVSKRSRNQMQIIVRPEIRKGCVWELQFKFSDAVVAVMTEFSTIENNLQKLPVLQLTVKSKLINTELPFTKVGLILNDGSNIIINKSNIALLNVKFTSRPRTVFHRHSDVMILIAVIKKGDQIICSDEIELIFRGGTGSVHSADNKKESAQGFVKMDFREPIPLHGILKGEHGPHDPLFFPGQMGQPPMLPRPDGIEGMPPELMPIPPTFEEFLRQNQMWNEGGVPIQDLHHFHQQMAAQQFHQQQFQQHPHLQHLQHLPPHPHLPPHLQPPHLQPHLQQLQQLQQQQIQQLQQQQQQPQQEKEENEKIEQEKEVQKTQPSQIQETERESPTPEEDAQQSENGEKKRKTIENTANFDEPAAQKKQRIENDSGFQNLFFTCLSNMGLPNITGVCSTAQTPIFVNNLQSEIIYANPAFYTYISEAAEVPNEFSSIKELQNVFDSLAADRSSTHDKFVLTQEEKSMNKSTEIFQKSACLFVKQWANLPDGQIVIIGMIVPGQTTSYTTSNGHQ